MKGIVLAGGSGTRLYPITSVLFDLSDLSVSTDIHSIHYCCLVNQSAKNRKSHILDGQHWTLLQHYKHR